LIRPQAKLLANEWEHCQPARAEVVHEDVVDCKHNTMKTLRLLITAFSAIFALSSVAFALPPGKDGSPVPILAKKSQFESLKTGDKVALVCKASDTVMVIDIKDSKQAMALCKEGRMIHCPDCKKKYKVTWTPPGKSGGPLTTKLVIVNEKGQPCMFFVKLS
jgi:hypothetical protein